MSCVVYVPGNPLYEAMRAHSDYAEPQYVGHLGLVEGVRFVETSERRDEAAPRDLERMRARLKTMGAY